jgi:hypothetical protein
VIVEIPPGVLRDLVAQQVDVSMRDRVLHDRELPVDLRRVLPPELDLLLGRYRARGNRRRPRRQAEDRGAPDACQESHDTASPFHGVIRPE